MTYLQAELNQYKNDPFSYENFLVIMKEHHQYLTKLKNKSPETIN